MIRAVAKFFYDTESKCLIESFYGFFEHEDFKTHNNKTIELFKENNCGNLICDISAMGTYSAESQDWIIVDWFPRALQAGYRRLGIVVTEDFYNKLPVEEIKSVIENIGFITHYFTTVKAAMEWIKGEQEKFSNN